MKNYLLTVLLLVAGCTALDMDPAVAQGRLRVHGSAGLTKAMSPANFSNRYRAGLNGGVALGYELDRIGFEPMVTVMFNKYRIDPTAVGGEKAEIDGGDRSVWSAAVGTYFHMNSGTRPYRGRTHLYVLARIGVYGLQIDGAAIETATEAFGWESRSETKLGAGFGFGLEVPLADRFSFKLEPVVDVAFTSGERTSVFMLSGGFIFNR